MVITRTISCIMLEEKIARARDLLATVRHAAMATVNTDGSPHNTPYRFMIDDSLQNLYWGSHPDSLHSQNIVRTRQLFVVLFDTQLSGGLYIAANKSSELSGQELTLALELHNKLRSQEGKPSLALEYYTEGQQRMYGAKPTQFWVNYSEKDQNGLIIKDIRQEISREQLA